MFKKLWGYKNNEEEKLNMEKKANPMNSFLSLVNRVKKNKNNENINIIDTNEEIKNEEIKNEENNGEDSFEENLLKECQKEDIQP